MKKEIEIPEGYEAKIEGNKVVLVPKESEDERIRKIILLALIASEDELSNFYKVHKIHRKECTDWLEKQKEQQPAYWSEEDTLHLTNAILASKKEWGEDSATVAFLKSLRHSWKPSKKQIEALEKVRTIFHNNHLWDEINPILYDYEELMRDLEALPMRCSKLSDNWKPSEEQMQGLRRGIVKADEGSDAKNAMVSLHNDLQKLL